MTKQDIMSTKVGEDTPIGGKESREQMKESETHPCPLLEVLQNQQADIHSIYPEDLVQTHAGPVLDASVS